MRMTFGWAVIFCWGLALPQRGTAQAAAPAVVHPAFPGGETPLGQEIAGLLADPGVSRAHWGIAVTALDGTPVYGVNEGQFFRPASNGKLFTTVAAMAMLGPEATFTTRVAGEGRLQRGVLHGDLVLRGGGDANFAGGYALPDVPKAQRPAGAKGPGLMDFDALAAQVAAAGVREIDGDIVGDDTRFENTMYPPGWAEEDLLWGYGAPVSALTVHDNQLVLKITPAPSGKQAKDMITLEPAVPFYTVNATRWNGQIAAVYNDDFGGNQVLEARQPNERDFHVEGDVAARYGAYSDELAIDRPAEFAAAAFKQALEKMGVVVKGGVRAQHHGSGEENSFLKKAHELPTFTQFYKMWQEGTTKLGSTLLFTPAYRSTCQAQRAMAAGEVEPEEHALAQKVSVPLSEDLVLTLKESQNLHAEMMLRNLGVETDCMSGSLLSTALAWERAFLTLKVGLDGGDFEFFDGSGLSTKDLVTPRATAQLLVYASQQPWFAPWKAALPVGGVDGTLAGRFKDAPMKGHVFAKTGTLGESRGLSGYLECASGRTVVFSIFVDTHSPVGSADRAVMDKVVAAVQRRE
jgi:D-alanyl-D-alanine carboxypeptidase/D-alanyl-D-alanine-endopeptidase (penicillin-binding protein 4)